jgi:hypothetical protein
MKETWKNEEPARKEFTGRTDDRLQHQRIAERAYELHQKRGGYHGQDLEDWLEAERMLLSEQKTSGKPENHLKSMPTSHPSNIKKHVKKQKTVSE